jgi:hypothetical protein
MDLSTFWARPFPLLHHYVFFGEKLSDANLGQNFTLNPKIILTMKKIRYTNILILKRNFDRSKQRHQVVAPKIFSPKILSVKNYRWS